MAYSHHPARNHRADPSFPAPSGAAGQERGELTFVWLRVALIPLQLGGDFPSAPTQLLQTLCH